MQAAFGPAHQPHFEIEQPDPFMTLAPNVRADKRDRIPAAVHVDGTGRIQTVERSANPRYYGLIEEFGRLTGVPVLLNTSFNRTEPIVASPARAVRAIRSRCCWIIRCRFRPTSHESSPRSSISARRPSWSTSVAT